MDLLEKFIFLSVKSYNHLQLTFNYLNLKELCDQHKEYNHMFLFNNFLEYNLFFFIYFFYHQGFRFFFYLGMQILISLRDD